MAALSTLCFAFNHSSCAQGLINDVPVSASCLELHQRAMSQIRDGRISDAEATVSSTSAKIEGIDYSCAGLVLNDMAAFMSGFGRLTEAASFAEQSIQAFQVGYSPENPVFLRPLSVLAAARFEEGRTALARAAFHQMQLIRIERPIDRAIFHGVAASMLEAGGKWPEAESEYRNCTAAWEEAGLGESSDAAMVMTGLGVLYLKEGRLGDAERMLERAHAIIARAPDGFPMDRIYLLDARGVLRSRQGKWKEAEEALRQALSTADQQGHVEPSTLLPLLANCSAVLRKNHRLRDARAIEARIAALRHHSRPAAVVDVTDLLEQSKQARKPSAEKLGEKK